MSKQTAEVYTLPVTTFLPSFVIVAVSDDEKPKYNPQEVVGWEWRMTDKIEKIETIDCTELVAKWDITEEHRQSVLDELKINDLPDAPVLCPDID